MTRTAKAQRLDILSEKVRIPERTRYSWLMPRRRGLSHSEQVFTYFSVGAALSDALRSIAADDIASAERELHDALNALDDVAPDVSPKEAGDVLGVSEPTVRLWVRKGLLEVTQEQPQRLDAHSVSLLKQKVDRLRESDLNKRQWAATLQAAYDRGELDLVGAREGIAEAQKLQAGRRKRRSSAKPVVHR
jgi:hypothetical protein